MTYEIKNKYTRAVQKEFNRILFLNSKVDNRWQVEMNPSQIDEANDYLVMVLYGLTKEVIDEMDPVEFGELVDAVGK